MPKGKFKENLDLLLANFVDKVEDSVVSAWVVNTTAKEKETYLFEGLAEISVRSTITKLKIENNIHVA